jgi:hypothetical protein
MSLKVHGHSGSFSRARQKPALTIRVTNAAERQSRWMTHSQVCIESACGSQMKSNGSTRSATASSNVTVFSGGVSTKISGFASDGAILVCIRVWKRQRVLPTPSE